MRLSVCPTMRVRVYECKLGRERISVSINIYAWQTDQWLLKRSRVDDDGYGLYVLTKSDGGNDHNAYVRALAQIRMHERTGQMTGINSLIMLNLS